MRFIVPFAFAFILVFSSTADAQKTFSSYGNSRFEFFVEYPTDLLEPQPESDNHDGRIFTSTDGSVEMRVWGSTNALSRSVAEEFKAAVENETGATYKKAGTDWLVISGTKNGKIFYRKSIYNKGSDSFATVLIEYPKSKKKAYDKMVRRVANSLKFLE